MKGATGFREKNHGRADGDGMGDDGGLSRTWSEEAMWTTHRNVAAY
jgi:hypothetical protein